MHFMVLDNLGNKNADMKIDTRRCSRDRETQRERKRKGERDNVRSKTEGANIKCLFQVSTFCSGFQHIDV